MSDTTIRASLKALMESVPGIGVVHDYDRWVSDSEQLVNLFKVNPDDEAAPLHGWEITREGILSIARVSTRVKATYGYVIKGYYAMRDAVESEKLFQMVIDSIVVKFLDSPIANTEGHPLPSVPKITPYMFAGVLCHYAEVRIQIAEIVDATAIVDQALLTVLLTQYLKPTTIATDQASIIIQ